MAEYRRSEGVCLRRIEFSNTSQVATFLTPDDGRVPVIARGIHRAPKKGIRRGLELLARYDIVYLHYPNRSLDTLTEQGMREEFRGIRGGVERILCGYYAAELMRNFTAEGEPCRWLYALLLRTLRSFAAGRELGSSVLLLEIGALRHYGACPGFGACAECGGTLPGEGRVLFSAPDGGPLCPECGRERYRAPSRLACPVRARRLRELSGAVRALSDGPGALELEPEEIVACSRLLRFHMQYLLGKQLRLWKYLHGRHLSRSLRRIRRAGRE